jgi:replicative DNA helicase
MGDRANRPPRRSDRVDRPPDPDAASADHALRVPFDEAAEQALLGAVLFDPEVLRAVGSLVGVEDLYLESHRAIYRAMLDLEASNTAIDTVTLAQVLRERDEYTLIGGGSYLVTLGGAVPTASNAAIYAKLIREKSALRAVIAFARQAISDASGQVEKVPELLDQVAQRALALSMRGGQSNLVSISQALSQAIQRVQLLEADGGRNAGVTGVPSGFHALDRMTAGWQKGDLVILAARPGMGKTAFALNALSNAAIDRRGPVPGVIFSLEMPREQLAMRMWSFTSGVQMEKLKSGRVDADWSKLWPAVTTLHNAPIFIDDTPSLPVAEMMRKCRQLKREHNIGIVMVDYLQLMRGSSTRRDANREQEISEISRSLKAIAKELEVPVIALSQLNRGVESRTDKRPMLSDLRESGAIEQDADIIIFLYRDDYYEQLKGGTKDAKAPQKPTRWNDDDHSTTEVIIAKHRSGATGKVEVMFQKSLTRFTNMHTDVPPPPTDADAPPHLRTPGVQADYPPPGPDVGSDPLPPIDDGSPF